LAVVRVFRVFRVFRVDRVWVSPQPVPVPVPVPRRPRRMLPDPGVLGAVCHARRTGRVTVSRTRGPFWLVQLPLPLVLVPPWVWVL
jgi:hypothetical protein